jgi:coiled-coil domain-containing protein 63/114
LKEKIEKEMLSQKQMDDEMKDMQKRIVEKKRTINSSGGGSLAGKNDSQFSKQVKILENRLDKANQKFNESIAQNKSMREEIDALRKEKSVFDNVYSKLEK